jgi:hypothetical protein
MVDVKMQEPEKQSFSGSLYKKTSKVKHQTSTLFQQLLHKHAQTLCV